MFVFMNNRLVNSDYIVYINYETLISEEEVTVFMKNHNSEFYDYETVKGMEAYNIIMALCPSALEGEQAKYKRNAWAIHNLLGHPLMQVFSWLGLTSVGLKIHDSTTPSPINK